MDETVKKIQGHFMWIQYYLRRSRGSSVRRVTEYGLDDRGSVPDRGRGFFF
jgi:hypothetical protein